MTPKSCDLHPIATYLFVPIVMINPARIHVLNESLLSGISLPVFRRAIVKPLLRQLHLNETIKKFINVKPVSNAVFLFKVVGKGCNVSVT